MESTCKHMFKYKLLISNQEVTLKHTSAIFSPVFSVRVLFWIEEDTSPFGCGWLRDQICLFELADYWMRIKIHLGSVDSRLHEENNHNEIQEFLCGGWNAPIPQLGHAVRNI